MSLSWLINGFIDKELYAPFVLDKDAEYLHDLSKKYSVIKKTSHKCWCRRRKHQNN